MVLKNFLQGSNGETDIENRLMDIGREEGEMYGKSKMETYITVCKIDSQREFAVWLGKQTWALYHPRGDGERDEKEVQKGGALCLIHVDV